MLPDVFKFSNKWFSWDHPPDSGTNALNWKAWICLQLAAYGGRGEGGRGEGGGEKVGKWIQQTVPILQRNSGKRKLSTIQKNVPEVVKKNSAIIDL